MFGGMGQTNVKNLCNGGTMDGDVTITGDLTVSGGIGLSLSEVIEGTSTIDVTNTEALLVRKNSDGGDVFIVDTTNTRVGVGVTPTTPMHIISFRELYGSEWGLVDCVQCIPYPIAVQLVLYLNCYPITQITRLHFYFFVPLIYAGQVRIPLTGNSVRISVVGVSVVSIVAYCSECKKVRHGANICFPKPYP